MGLSKREDEGEEQQAEEAHAKEEAQEHKKNEKNKKNKKNNKNNKNNKYNKNDKNKQTGAIQRERGKEGALYLALVALCCIESIIINDTYFWTMYSNCLGRKRIACFEHSFPEVCSEPVLVQSSFLFSCRAFWGVL